MVDSLLSWFATLFEVGDSRARLSRRLGVLLALILVLGAVVRFWGLGAVGLHGDEKTMALPTMQLVEHGAPRMPSGMFYARALGQLYLMAGSVEAFGQSEWALRLPSAICGVLLILLTWTAGKRFLEPAWNLALTAAVALLPDFIDDAQTARMYVFLVTSVAAFMTLVFEWERTRRSGYLIAAVVAMLIGLQFHTLAIFAAFLLLMPGLLHGDRRRLWAGMLAFAVTVVGFYVINSWISASYPQDVAADAGPGGNGPRAALIPHISWLWLAAAAVPALLFAWFVLGGGARGAKGEPDARGAHDGRSGGFGAAPVRMAMVTLAAGLVAGLSMHYHIAALLIVTALVVARRAGGLSMPRVAMLLAVSAAMALMQAFYLEAHAAGTPRQIVGLLLGWPSLWPFIAIAESSPVAAILAAASLILGLWRLAHRQRVPDFVLLVFLGVWLPLIMIGFMRWDIPLRYAEAQSLPLLVGAFAMAQWAAPRVAAWVRAAMAAPPKQPTASAPTALAPAASPLVTGLAAALVCLLVTNPMRVAQAVDSGYSHHPDHKGAAEFVESVHPGPRDILVAEDVLQQTYYLGHVDYWLVNKQVGAVYLHRVQGRWLDFYTNTPLLGTGEDLKRLLERPDRGAVYVIGSGENQEDGRKLMRGFGIADELRAPQFKVVYRGRDGVTEVWKADAPQTEAQAAGAPQTEAQAAGARRRVAGAR